MKNSLICLKGIQKGYKLIDTAGNIKHICNCVSIPRKGYFLVKVESDGDLYLYKFVEDTMSV